MEDETVVEDVENDKQYTPLWYILDEFGSRIQHCDSPNVVFKHFFYVPKNISMTVMYPIQDIHHGGICIIFLSSSNFEDKSISKTLD